MFELSAHHYRRRSVSLALCSVLIRRTRRSPVTVLWLFTSSAWCHATFYSYLSKTSTQDAGQTRGVCEKRFLKLFSFLSRFYRAMLRWLPSRILKWALSFFLATCARLSWSLSFWVLVKLFFRIVLIQQVVRPSVCPWRWGIMVT